MKSNSLRIHCLIHVCFEGIGHIELWANKHKHHLSYTHLFEEANFPNQDEFDMLIIMGGPMNIYEEGIYSWLVTEKRFIKETIESNKAVIGFCLGSQLIADVLGGKVTTNNYKEIGWLPIRWTDAAKEIPILEKDALAPLVFHWHGDTFSIPPDSIIASSTGCLNQAFLYNEKVLGLQFHLEVTTDSLEEMLINGAEELTEGKYIQSAQHIKDCSSDFIPQCNHLLEEILDWLSSKQKEQRADFNDSLLSL